MSPSLKSAHKQLVTFALFCGVALATRPAAYSHEARGNHKRWTSVLGETRSPAHSQTLAHVEARDTDALWCFRDQPPKPNFRLQLVQQAPESRSKESPPKPTGEIASEARRAAAVAIAEKSLQWMPESFRRVLSKNFDGIAEGVAEIRSHELAIASERLRLEEIVLQRVALALDRLQSRPKFSESAKDLGALAEMMLLLNLPESDSRKLLELQEVIASNSSAFRVVVYDATEIGGSRDDLKGFLGALRPRRARLSERFADIAVGKSSSGRPASVDPRSPLFGLAALIYTHAINDTARIWLWIWRSANGDMSGRPSLLQPQ